MGSWVRIRLFDILHFVRDLLFPLLKNSKSGSQCQDRRTGVRDDNSIQIINIGRVGDKSFIEFRKK